MEKEKLCPICFTKIDDFNFCPACGEPLTSMAKELAKEQKTNTELALLVKLIDYINDPKDLKFLQGLIAKISE